MPSAIRSLGWPPPQVSVTRKADPLASYRLARRTIAIRHVSGHEIVALIEIASPANKDRPSSVAEFAEKLHWAVSNGIHILLIDLLPPGPHDPLGLHGEFWQIYDLETRPPAADHPLCTAAYEAGQLPDAWIQPLAVGDPLPQMPLFLDVSRYINVPLAASYDQAFHDMPGIYRATLEAKRTVGDSQAKST